MLNTPRKYSLVLCATMASVIKTEAATGLANADFDDAKIYWRMQSKHFSLRQCLDQDWRQPEAADRPTNIREIQPNLVRRDSIQVLIHLPTVYLGSHSSIKDLNVLHSHGRGGEVSRRNCINPAAARSSVRKMYESLADFKGLSLSDARNLKSSTPTPENSRTSCPVFRLSWRAKAKLAYPSYFKRFVRWGWG